MQSRVLTIAAALSLCLPCAIIIPYGCAAGPTYMVTGSSVGGEDSQDVLSAQSPAPTAGALENAASLRFNIIDEAGLPIPGRLTFVGDGGLQANLFPNADADPHHLAVRYNVIYSLDGAGLVTVPPGRYEIYASRGIEWSIDSTTITLEPGQQAMWIARLKHELDTTGFISGDFHLHTLTFSGHGDANLNERIISLVGEGVEFAVATDHNHNTDYRPTIDDLDAGAQLKAVTGNEVSTSIGHFNVFPLDPERTPVNHRIGDANELFRLLHAEENEFGIVPIIQLNHPRWGSIDYFGRTGLDPVTGVPTTEVFSHDFDSLEIMNENQGWGYFDAETSDLYIGSSRHSVLRDWFNLLNRGHRYTAVGNSDSHRVHYTYAGYPRNFVASTTDAPNEIDPAAIAKAVRAGQVIATTGPLVIYRVNGAEMGSDLAIDDGRATVDIEVRAASWIDCDRVKIIVNGDVAAELSIADSRAVDRFRGSAVVSISADSWLAVLVEGDDSLSPIVGDQGRAIFPIAIANPVWIDADGDGEWTSPWDQAVNRVESASTLREVWPAAGDTDRARSALTAISARVLTILAAADRNVTFAPDLTRRGLADADRRVRLAACRAAERLADAELVGALESAWAESASDRYLRAALLRAFYVCDPGDSQARLIAFLTDQGAEALNRYRDELAPLLPGSFVSDWMVLGYFDNPDQQTLVNVDYGPETETDAAQLYSVKGDAEGATTWRPMKSSDGGHLDLRLLDNRQAMYENAIAYARIWLRAPRDMTVFYTLGTDDGCRLYVNREMIFEDNTRHGASPLANVGKMKLRQGYNEILIKVENGGGGFGLYFRVLDDSVTASATR